MPVTFSLGHFLAAPSIELINSCRKCELLQIVDHFKLQVPKQILKCELKALLVGKLMEAGVIRAPDLPEAAVVVPIQSALPEEEHKHGSGVDSEVGAQGKMPHLLPCYDPLFSVSSES
ncbi:hypothetical protein XENOCAPTIV_002442 [Xenoophorus captivus]|uniref:Uncharacterized protein n=1 Tax=Xenoophorus captivus TaxID=1517983 RepID=A0ABV0RD68_9TELE